MAKKIYAVNGSPRENGNTAKILQSALDGAASCGAETALIHLGRYQFSGCRSCFACKLKDGKSYGKCAVNDGITAILDELSRADAIIMGSPIYFGAESGLYRCFLERLFFPYLKYSNPASSIAPKTLEMAFVYTMNVPAEVMDMYGYRDFLEKGHKFPQLVFGSREPEILYVNDTYQFDDYSRYESDMFDPEHKKAMRETLFVKDCAKAFDLGKKITQRA